MSIIALALESFVFNYKSLSFGNEETSASFTHAYSETPESVQSNAGSIVFSDDGSVVIPVNAEGIGALSLKFDGSDEWIRCSVDTKDSNFQNIFINVGDKFASSDSEAEFTLHTYKSLNEIRINLSEVDSPVTITGCTFSKTLPFNFSDLRFY